VPTCFGPIDQWDEGLGVWCPVRVNRNSEQGNVNTKELFKGHGVYNKPSVFCVPKLSYIQMMTRHNVDEFYIPGYNAV
jgi:hypothetical protein